MLARSTPEAMPQLQNVTRMLCGLVAAAPIAPAIIRRLFGRRAHFGYRPAAVVDRGRPPLSGKIGVVPLVERRHPVRRRVVLAQVHRWSRLNGASRSWRYASLIVRFPTNVC